MEDIKTRLTKFRERCARAAVLQVEITHLQYKIEKVLRNPPRAPYEPAELPICKVQDYNDMPRSRVLYGTLESGEGFDPSKELRAALEKSAAAVMQLTMEQRKLEAALECLGAKEKLVVLQSYVQGKHWHDIAQNFETEFGYSPCEAWIIRIRKEALEKLERCLETEFVSEDSLCSAIVVQL